MDDLVNVTIVQADFEIEEDLKDLEFCRFTLVEVGKGWAIVKFAYRKNKDESGFVENTLMVKDRVSLSFDKPWHWTD